MNNHFSYSNLQFKGKRLTSVPLTSGVCLILQGGLSKNE